MGEKSNKIKVLYIITKSVWAGASKYVYDLAVGLPKDKFNVFVAAGGQGELAQKISKASIPYFEIKHFQRDISIFKEIFAYFEILGILLKIRPDIIHVNSSKAGMLAGMSSLDYRFLTLNFKIKTIFTAHGWAFHEKRPGWQIFLIKLFTKLTAFYYSKIICVSEYDYQSAIKNRITPPRKLIVIRNGIKPEDYQFLSKKEARKKLRITNYELRVIGTIGEFTKNKGHIYLIEAIKNSKFLISNAKFFIIGFGEEISNLKSQISNLGLEEKIFLIEGMPDAYKYLKAFDIFVLPSIKEGLPYVLLEAGLAELPVVATNVGGIPEVIEDKKMGFLVNPAEPEELARAIKKLIEDEKIRKILSNNLLQKILKEFTFEKMLKKTLATYEDEADS